MKIELYLPDQVINEEPEFCTFNLMLQQMLNRMAFSHFKYGNMSDKYPDSARAIDSVGTRLNLYAQTGNVEHLLDAANFAVIEACFPSHDKAHFRATDSHESPGITYIEEN